MLRVENISKQFSGIQVLHGVNMELFAGKVNAIIGENGAGKSTLMRILSGVYTDYGGEIFFNEKPVRFNSPKEAQELGISIIHQELNLIPYLSVRENIFLGRELTTQWNILDVREMRRRTKEVLEKLHLDVHPDTPVNKLKVGQQQVVEIAKALLFDAEMIIMDEPTSAISDQEVEVLFSIIKELKKENKAIVYISHKLDELFRIADYYNVLRDGRFIEAGKMKDIDQEHLIHKMVGRELVLTSREAKKNATNAVLSVEQLCLTSKNRRNEKTLDNINFKVHKGEVVGLFGLMGAGRTELLETLFGLHHNNVSGNIHINSDLVHFRFPADAIKKGVALVPEDRKKDGIFPGLNIRENISITTLNELEKFRVLNNSKENDLANKYLDLLKIKTPSLDQYIENLSGGNQQKVVLAKWLATHPEILLLDEPTRGIDVNAKNEIYKLISDLSKSGLCILVASSELPEILAISDRILVLSEGKLTAEFLNEGVSEDDILEAAIPKTI